MKKIYCFDLDGTVTGQELLPLLAKEIGIYDKILSLTNDTINGLIPFEQSFKLRCKLLSSIPLKKIQEISNKVNFNESIVKFIKENKDNSFIITGNIYEWVKPIVDKIGCKIFCSEARFENDKFIRLEKIINKGEVIKKLKETNKSIISVGDGMGDVLMFQESDISIAYGGVHDPIQTLVKSSNYLVYNEKSLCRLLNTL
jgi:phosphoserine phosphatase